MSLGGNNESTGFPKTREYIIGDVRKYNKLPNYIYNNGADDGGADVNTALDYLIAKGEGEVLLEQLLNIKDENIVAQDGKSKIEIIGRGHPDMIDNPAVYLASYAKTGMIFDNKTITNALGSFRKGSIGLKKMTLGVHGITVSKPFIDTDFLHFDIEDVLFQEWGNTFSGGDGLLTPLTGGITPNSVKTSIKNSIFHLKSPNVVAIGPHNENIDIDNCTFSFQTEDQVGVHCLGAGAHSVRHPLIWFGGGAHACEVFKILNTGKDWNFYDVSGSTQMGGLDETCSLFSEESGVGDGLAIVAKVYGLRGSFEWAIKSEATNIAIWKDEATQLVVRLYGSNQGVPIPGTQNHQLFLDYSPAYSTPTAVYTAKSQHAHRPIDLTGVQHARFWGTLKASDDIAGHGACAYDECCSEVLAEVIWDNQPAVDKYIYGAWTPVRKTGIHRINYYRKGGDAADQISEDVVGVELR